MKAPIRKEVKGTSNDYTKNVEVSVYFFGILIYRKNLVINH